MESFCYDLYFQAWIKQLRGNTHQILEKYKIKLLLSSNNCIVYYFFHKKIQFADFIALLNLWLTKFNKIKMTNLIIPFSKSCKSNCYGSLLKWLYLISHNTRLSIMQPAIY